MHYFHIHPDNPQARLIKQVAQALQGGAVLLYPTDATYAFGCLPAHQDALARIAQLRQKDKKHRFTLLCQDLSGLAQYAQVDNRAFRLLKKCTPGPYTFILRGSSTLPRRLADPKRKTLGLRIPDHPIVRALLEAIGGPLLSSTAQLPGDEMPLTDPQAMRERLAQQVDVMIDGGTGGMTPTTIIDCTADAPQLVRAGCGDIDQI